MVDGFSGGQLPSKSAIKEIKINQDPFSAAYDWMGFGRIEIVTKPIVVEPALAPLVARAYVTELRELIVALGVSDARMHQGSMRVDANVSLKPKGSPTFGIISFIEPSLEFLLIHTLL